MLWIGPSFLILKVMKTLEDLPNIYLRRSRFGSAFLKAVFRRKEGRQEGRKEGKEEKETVGKKEGKRNPFLFLFHQFQNIP